MDEQNMSKNVKKKVGFHLPSDASKSATASHTTICRPLATKSPSGCCITFVHFCGTI
jgi:hypothetical protein